ncbi:LysR substrate-binding domain-containing protein [Rhizorhabdus dicambivorans]|uniref:LysR family transcriptional regulator n=1 Tax=Rhizorhabdus dicambivorans TaxID=1850238 RepID=A0A2A4FQU1_9SPHN|nr:LysR substrate-binding domain-containing protein [Rhizorhabdus dicambivorans]ATE65792.1 LysR family transcriptional regulator [Rhizorhabdus dicambivorans]PCE41125.1 LysR family transcriptional regulator [Rhizorhabdus dicambivorans]
MAESGSIATPPFASLRAFEAVFRLGGIRKAAVHLGVNHAVVSRHIKLIEEWFGLPLVERSGHRLCLTEPGARYHARISAAFAEITIATEELAGLRNDAPLRLWCIPGLAIQWLSGQLAIFERTHPGSRIELKPSDVSPNLMVHEADADIRYYRDGDRARGEVRGLRGFDLARPEVMAVASPQLVSSLSAAITPDVLSLPLLHEENDLEWRAWIRLNGVEPPERLPGPLCYHAHLALAAARQGRGIALASRFLVGEDLAQGNLVEVPLPGMRPQILGGYVLVAREDRWSAPVLAALRTFLRRQVAELL